jgi:hypothetical protein
MEHLDALNVLVRVPHDRPVSIIRTTTLAYRRFVDFLE